MPKKKTNEEYIAELHELYPHITPKEPYNGAHRSILHYCSKHNKTWKAAPHNVLHKGRCPICGKEAYSKNKRIPENIHKNQLSENNPNVALVGEYTLSSKKTLYFCKKHSVFWMAMPCRVAKGSGCFLCKKEKFNKAKTRSTEEYENELENRAIHVEPLEDYVDCKTKILHRCKTHGIEWNTTPDSVLEGHGCPQCLRDKISVKNSKDNKTYLEDLKCKNPNVISLEPYIGANTKIKHKCAKCGYIWSVMPSSLLSGKGCPRCRSSHGEMLVCEYLNMLKFDYIREKRFEDCRDIRSLPFDFYIPQLNTCIEYDGAQHFTPVNFTGEGPKKSKELFDLTKKHDDIKNKYCHSKGIKLIRIPYYKDVESELDKYFK